jgi:iron complex transport system substrate-binding protein
VTRREPQTGWAHRARLALLCAVALAQPVSATPVELRDDRGHAISLAAPAQRIIALAPSITELVFAAGAGDRLVAVARFSDYPSAAAQLPQIGDAARIDIERVLALRPDLIVAWKSGNQAADVARLEELGFSVFVAEPSTLAAIPQVLRAIGALAGTSAAADGTAREFERAIADLRTRFANRMKVRVFYEIWHWPLMTVNGRHVISDVIKLCGGSNVFAAAPVLTPVISLESVIYAQPQVVLGGSSATTPELYLAAWRQYSDYAKLRNVQVLYVDPDRIQRQTPRILEGARIVCDHLERVRARKN